MRVIGGEYRGRRLRTAEGRAVRPTSDRLRETLFNILSPGILNRAFLDVCAGSGAVGIEALSRGAGHATFIDRSRSACSIIRQNLESLGLEDRATIINRDAAVALKRLSVESRKFDIVFVDPPYDAAVHGAIMTLLGSGTLVGGEGIVVVEYHARRPLEDEFGALRAYREVKQGESALTFYAAV